MVVGIAPRNLLYDRSSSCSALGRGQGANWPSKPRFTKLLHAELREAEVGGRVTYLGGSISGRRTLWDAAKL